MSAGFRFEKQAAAWWPVVWTEAVDGGDVREVQIELKFWRKPSSEADELLKLPNGEFLAAAASGWRGLADEDGEPVPFDDLWRARWLEIPAVPVALVTAWLGFQRGEPARRLGNSGPSAAGGPEAAGATAGTKATPTP